MLCGELGEEVGYVEVEVVGGFEVDEVEGFVVAVESALGFECKECK